ncbi:hypothetical protein DY000_02046404 [Brassica cretica]|uniref:Uncharacterized protein n=1 Tax=Brassica cretica TaxID=69181 RepID=A0ABQ7EMN3_BRACR|nr:hypothetical protein DY000_02046404 [Brassica cretica]
MTRDRHRHWEEHFHRASSTKATSLVDYSVEVTACRMLSPRIEETEPLYTARHTAPPSVSPPQGKVEPESRTRLASSCVITVKTSP